MVKGPLSLYFADPRFVNITSISAFQRATQYTQNMMLVTDGLPSPHGKLASQYFVLFAENAADEWAVATVANKHETFTWCSFNAGPTSATLAQH